MRINTSDKAIIMVDGRVDFVYLRAMFGEEKIMHQSIEAPTSFPRARIRDKGENDALLNKIVTQGGGVIDNL